MARSDYTKEQRDAFQRSRINSELARGQYSRTQQIDAFLAGKPMPKQPAQPSIFKKLDQALSKEIDAILSPPKKEQKVQSKGGNLSWNGDSDCFDALYFSKSAQGVIATFSGPAAGDWFYPMSKADARDWFNADSVGEYFNAFIREAHGKGK